MWRKKKKNRQILLSIKMNKKVMKEESDCLQLWLNAFQPVYEAYTKLENKYVTFSSSPKQNNNKNHRMRRKKRLIAYTLCNITINYNYFPLIIEIRLCICPMIFNIT